MRPKDSIQPCSSGGTACDVSCPPIQRVSSVSTTRSPLRAAASAAATPPVPPPMTAISHLTSRAPPSARRAAVSAAGAARNCRRSMGASLARKARYRCVRSRQRTAKQAAILGREGDVYGPQTYFTRHAGVHHQLSAMRGDLPRNHVSLPRARRKARPGPAYRPARRLRRHLPRQRGFHAPRFGVPPSHLCACAPRCAAHAPKAATSWPAATS